MICPCRRNLRYDPRHRPCDKCRYRTPGRLQQIISILSIERIVPTISDDHIVQSIAGAVDPRCAGQGQILDIRIQGKDHRALNRIDAAIRVFPDEIADIIHNVRIIAMPAQHRIGTAAAIQRIVTLVAFEIIVPALTIQLIRTISAI